MSKSPEMQQFVDNMAEIWFGKTPAGCCVSCKQPFSDSNTHSALGWKETKISGLCEDCFDKAFDWEGKE